MSELSENTLCLCLTAMPDAATLIDGRRVCGAVTVPASGELLVSAVPLDASGYFGITRLISIKNGQVIAAPPDTEVYPFPDCTEIVLHMGKTEPTPLRTFPHTLAQLPWERQLAVLYHDGGLWLSVENRMRVLAGFPLHGKSGTLHGIERTLLAVTEREALSLAPDRSIMLRLIADSIGFDGETLTAIERLPTSCGYEHRVCYRFCRGAWASVSDEVGFFTHDRADVPPALAFFEALSVGRVDDALIFCTPSLADGLDADTLKDFFGEFSRVRLHPLEENTAALIDGDCIRCFTVSLDGGRIDNIEEV